MNQKHIHCDVIKAWADGAQIQMESDGEWIDKRYPSWSEFCNYRVKPPITKWYRVALMKHMTKGNLYTITADSSDMERYISTHKEFVRWVTDRQYVEI